MSASTAEELLAERDLRVDHVTVWNPLNVESKPSSVIKPIKTLAYSKSTCALLFLV